MKHNLKNLLLTAIGLSSLATIGLRADPVKVQEAGVGPAETAWIDSIDGASTSAAVLAEITSMQNFLANNPNAVTADLIAVTGPGQDYVIPNVPDGGVTLCMLGLALVGLVAFRKKFRAC